MISSGPSVASAPAMVSFVATPSRSPRPRKVPNRSCRSVTGSEEMSVAIMTCSSEAMARSSRLCGGSSAVQIAAISSTVPATSGEPGSIRLFSLSQPPAAISASATSCLPSAKKWAARQFAGSQVAA